MKLLQPNWIIKIIKLRTTLLEYIWSLPPPLQVEHEAMSRALATLEQNSTLT